MVSEIPQQARDEIIDEEHLRLLTIGHYITGGFCIAFASIFIFHFIFVLIASANPEFFAGHGANAPGAPPDGVMKVFAVVLGLVILAGWTFGGLTIYAGRCIKRRAHRSFTFVIAALNLMFMPFGTVLGVFTLMVLSRANVKRLYGP